MKVSNATYVSYILLQLNASRDCACFIVQISLISLWDAGSNLYRRDAYCHISFSHNRASLLHTNSEISPRSKPFFVQWSRHWLAMIQSKVNKPANWETTEPITYSKQASQEKNDSNKGWRKWALSRAQWGLNRRLNVMVSKRDVIVLRHLTSMKNVFLSQGQRKQSWYISLFVHWSLLSVQCDHDDE